MHWTTAVGSYEELILQRHGSELFQSSWTFLRQLRTRMNDFYGPTCFFFLPKNFFQSIKIFLGVTTSASLEHLKTGTGKKIDNSSRNFDILSLFRRNVAEIFFLRLVGPAFSVFGSGKKTGTSKSRQSLFPWKPYLTYLKALGHCQSQSWARCYKTFCFLTVASYWCASSSSASSTICYTSIIHHNMIRF